MHKILLEIPNRVYAERIYLRPYQAGDGPLLYKISRKNHQHLAEYESDNALLTIKTVEDAEILARELAAAWLGREYFFLGVFDRETDEFVAQIYIGPVNWELPEFEMGYIADVDHEGQGYVSKAVRAALDMIFNHLQAHRVRLECADSNVRSWRVAERCGFRREGHLRQNRRMPDGSYSSAYLYGMLKDDFET
jgi:RimJ/RimL family protein N-acetyltransferase